MICESCQSLLRELWSCGRSEIRDYSQLKSSVFHKPALTGTEPVLRSHTCFGGSPCHICARVLARWKARSQPSEYFSILRERFEELDVLPVTVRWYERFDYQNAIEIAIPVANELEHHHGLILENFDLDPIANAASQYITSPRLDTHINTCGRQVLQWLKTCVGFHDACSISRKTKWYPTRLLDLGVRGANFTTGLIKLIESQEHVPIGPYVTLSHCWGKAKPLKLTKDSFQRFKEGIHIEDLPKTFQDAIVVSRYLQIRYLWIDSLTIIQGDAEDWMRESSMMEYVYRHSLCNIGATASRDSNGGLFFDSRSEFVWSDALVLGGQRFQLTSPNFWKDVENQPLMKRAWAVQERWLCPRMLHFCHGQLYWECRTGVASENLPAIKRGSAMSQTTHLRKSSTFAETMDVWQNIVFYYSCGKLTMAKDKLVALSGMAREVHGGRRDEYMAGLCYTNFVHGLSWQVSHEDGDMDEECYRPNEYIAPSWSWASVTGRISMKFGWYDRLTNHRNYHETTSVVEVHVEHVGLDDYGQIKSGYARLTGPMMEVVAYKDGSLHYQNTKITAEIFLDVGTDRQAERLDFWFLSLYLFGIEPRYSRAVGILLQRITGTVDHFQRAGLGAIDTGDAYYTGHHSEIDGSDINSKIFIDEILQPTKINSLPDDLYDPERGYTITIV